MAIRWHFILFIVMVFTFNITEFECRSSGRKLHGNINKTLYKPAPLRSITDVSISEMLDNASGLFQKIIGKMLANKKLVGFDSGWYW